MTTTVRTACLAAALAVAGCRTPERAPPAPALSPRTVRVIDAETRRPLPGAAVHLAATAGPDAAAATAGADGVAALTAVRDDDGEWTASASAAGYLPDSVELHAAAGQAAPPAEVALFAGPAPAVRLTVPGGYRGPVVVTLKVDSTLPPGRAFAATADDAGAATLAGPPAVKLVKPFAVTATFADGKAIPAAGTEEAVRFQWVRTAGDLMTFYVGTASDCDAYRKTLDPPSRPSPGGKGGGGGGGRRGGGGKRGGGGGGGGPPGGGM